MTGFDETMKFFIGSWTIPAVDFLVAKICLLFVCGDLCFHVVMYLFLFYLGYVFILA